MPSVGEAKTLTQEQGLGEFGNPESLTHWRATDGVKTGVIVANPCARFREARLRLQAYSQCPRNNGRT